MVKPKCSRCGDKKQVQSMPPGSGFGLNPGNRMGPLIPCPVCCPPKK